MKKFSLLILCFLVLIPSMVSAHTHLAVSNPSEGQVVADELKEITLTFDGNIEKISSMKVVKNGSELKGLQVQTEAEKMFGILPEPLANGDYVIQWNIAGEDGHPLAGEIHFTVQKEEKSDMQTSVPEQGQDSAGANDGNKTTIDGSDGSEEVSSQNPNISLEENTKSYTTTILTILGFVIILGVGLLLLRKKPLL